MDDTAKWLKISLLNLVMVAFLGLLMRYKIGFSFPFLEQKALQFGHSYFAFYGWISQTLMVLMVHALRRHTTLPLTHYGYIFWSNLIASYGLLLSFVFMGYGIASSVFSAALIVTSYIFAFHFWRDTARTSYPAHIGRWFRAALFFSVLSTFGSLVLAWMTLSGHLHQNAYLALVYYFLHFQYNGWFFFACMGLLLEFTGSRARAHDTGFWLFFSACIPAYLLSVLWLSIPVWIEVVVGIFALLQLIAWGLQLRALILEKPTVVKRQPAALRYIIFFVAIALSIKLLLQLGSTVPAISKLAFGFRPVVIAYLHLVLLAINTLFLLFYLYANRFFHLSKIIRLGLWIFALGVFLNELILAVQGVAGFSYTLVPYVNEGLLGAAIILFSSIVTLALHSEKVEKIDVL